MQNQDYTCSHCNAPATEQEKFCANCGSLFSEGWFCSIHNSVEAKGVCVICSKPFCGKCGRESNGVFLCDPHWQFEIHEGMARIFGSTDNVQAQYVVSLLKQAGYHPFLYSRMFNPTADLVSILKVPRNYGNNSIVEMKVLVPFSEVLRAQKVLNQLGINGN